MDPRSAVIGKRLKDVDRIVAVTGGKGGIGKSLVSSLLALTLANRGRKVGLLDLDLTGPTDHVILGLDDRFPTEEFGLEPPDFHGIRFLSVTCFIGDSPAPLRGADVTNAILEILAITRWQDLDALVIDMPPGLGDTTLDMVRLLPRAEYLIVSTASKVVMETVRRMLQLLGDLGANVTGVMENMRRCDSGAVQELAASFGHDFLGSLPFDEGVEEVLGDPDRLAGTAVLDALDTVGRELFP